MDIGDIFGSGERRKECKKTSAKALFEKLESQSKEETSNRLHAFLEEVASIIDFAQQRLNEASDEYEEFAGLGNFGAVVSVAMMGKPLAYGALGSEKGIKDAMKFAMLRTIAQEFDGEKAEQDESSGEEN